jgi:hypothetical protein
MKRILGMLGLMICLLIFICACEAMSKPAGTGKGKAKYETLHATVVSLNRTRQELVVKDNSNGDEIKFTILARDMKSLKEGDEVKIKFESNTRVIKNIRAEKGEKSVAPTPSKADSPKEPVNTEIEPSTDVSTPADPGVAVAEQETAENETPAEDSAKQ